MEPACESYTLMQRNTRYFDSMDPDSNENKNTKRKTETDMRIFTAYLVSRLLQYVTMETHSM